MKMQEQRIEPTESIKKKISNFHQIRTRVQDYLMSNEDFSDFAAKVNGVLSHAALTYSVSGESVVWDNVNRTSSMVCGPVFISEEYPHLLDSKDEKMFPALQLDLNWINRVCDKNFENGLLQLWWSPDTREDWIRFIPASHVNLSLVQPIELDPDLIVKALDWIPFEWRCEDKSKVFTITRCTPIGITYPPFNDEVDEFVENSIDKIDKPIVNDLNKLCYCDSYHSSRVPKGQHLFDLFGYFNHHAVAAYEVDSEYCLLHLRNLQSGFLYGNIFYDRAAFTGASGFSFSYGR